MKNIIIALVIFVFSSLNVQAQNGKSDKEEKEQVLYTLKYEATNQVVGEYDTLINVILVAYTLDIEQCDQIEFETTSMSGSKSNHKLDKTKALVMKKKSMADDDDEAAKLREKLKFHKYYKEGKDEVSEISLGVMSMRDIRDIKVKLLKADKSK